MLSKEEDDVHAIDVPQSMGWQIFLLECYDGLIRNVEDSGLGGLHQREENNESSALSPTL